MSDEIPPALDPAEWTANDDGPTMYAKGIDDMLNTIYEEESPIAYFRRGTLSILDGPVGPITYHDPASFHGLMALANAALPDGDRRKLTPLMVRQLRETAAWHRAHGGAVVADGLAVIADALAAILPPESEASGPTNSTKIEADDVDGVYRCEGGPWDGQDVALSRGAVAVRVSADEAGYDTRSGATWIGAYELDGNRLVWTPYMDGA